VFILTCPAFGIFVRALEDTDEYKPLREAAAGVDLADSITIDGHKLLNVVSKDSIHYAAAN
jgi:glutamate/tyrosine decarboxylase-like PLP-dependent enzyme